MKTVGQRAMKIAECWYADAPDADAEDNDLRIRGLASAIEMALKTQDKLTRHAVADAISAEYARDMIYSEYIAISRAHSIAMNTSAL